MLWLLELLQDHIIDYILCNNKKYIKNIYLTIIDIKNEIY